MLEIVLKDKIEQADEDEWINLWSKSKHSHFFNSPYWYKACLTGLLQKISIWFVYDNTRLIAIIPLCKSIKYAIPCLSTIGNPYTDKCPILIDDKYFSEIPNILSQIGKNKPIILCEVPEGWNISLSRNLLMAYSSSNPFIRLNEEILHQVKRGEWNNVKRKAEKTPYCFKVFRGMDAHKIINILWDIEATSNKPKRRRAMFRLEKVKAMFEIASMSDCSLLAVLFDNDLPIAHMFGYSVGNTFLAHHMAFREEYFKDVPGKIVIVKLISYLLEFGCEVFDFSRGETVLKKHFSTYREINNNYYCNLHWINRQWFRLVMLSIKIYKKLRHRIKQLFLAVKGFRYGRK